MSKETLQPINVGAMILLKNNRHLLSKHQFDTLRGQILAGDAGGAMKGLRKLLLLQGSNAVKKQN